MDLRTETKKTLIKRDWTMCSNFVNWSRFNSQPNWGDLYDHLSIKRTFPLIKIKIFI